MFALIRLFANSLLFPGKNHNDKEADKPDHEKENTSCFFCEKFRFIVIINHSPFFYVLYLDLLLFFSLFLRHT